MLPITDQEHRLLYDSAQSFLAQRCHRRWVRSAPRWNDAPTRQIWSEVAELGWLGVLMPEDQGGLGLTMQEACILGERAGSHLFALPLGASAVLSALVHRAAPRSPLPTADLCMGRAMLAWLPIGTAAPDYLLDHFGQATHVLTTRQRADAGLDIGLADIESLTLKELPALDPSCPLASWAPSADEPKRMVSPIATLTPQAARVLDSGWRLYRLAELLGVAQGGFKLTTEYVRERVQFGAPIGSFQAIKHRLADTAMALDLASLALWAAASRLGDGTPDEIAELAVDHAHVAIDLAASRVRREVIQLHGGIGFTWECDAHLYQKRIIRLSSGLASGAALRRIAAHEMREATA